jgi:hypothetical protein
MKIDKTSLDISKGVMKGMTKGGLVGSAASIASGAAVIVTAPAWVPFVGGAMAVSAATVATWAAIGAGVGALSGGAFEYAKARKRDRDFEDLILNVPPDTKKKNAGKSQRKPRSSRGR